MEGPTSRAAPIRIIPWLLLTMSVVVGSPAAAADVDGEAPDRRPELLTLMGTPDAFVMTVDEIEDELVRFESWMYYEAATQFDLVDGELLWAIDLDLMPDGSLYPLQYEPAMFEPLMSRADVKAALPDVQLMEVGIGDDAMENAGFLAGEQLLLGFVDDQLVYAESFALVPERS